MCLGYISKAFTVDNIKKNGINGYINEFSVDFNIIDATDTVDIRKYSIKIKYKITFRLIKNVFIGLLSFLEKLVKMLVNMLLFLVYTIVHQHTSIMKKNILILGKNPTQRLADTT